MKRKIYWKNIKHGLVIFLIMAGSVMLFTGELRHIPLLIAIAGGTTISNMLHDIEELNK